MILVAVAVLSCLSVWSRAPLLNTLHLYVLQTGHTALSDRTAQITKSIQDVSQALQKLQTQPAAPVASTAGAVSAGKVCSSILLR